MRLRDFFTAAALLGPLMLVFFLFTGPVCQTYTVPETEQGVIKASALLHAGWFGKADDGAERLYSPQCK